MSLQASNICYKDTISCILLRDMSSFQVESCFSACRFYIKSDTTSLLHWS